MSSHVVPFNDLARQHESLSADLQAGYDRVLGASSFILGKEVLAFEVEWAQYLGVEHAVGCSNGTDALVLALLALGVSEGDEVILPSFTFFATLEAVISVGARPVLVDVSEETANISVEAARQAITDKTKAIIAVHLYGCAADLAGLLSLCKEHNLFLVEDSAQAHAAEWRAQKLGTIGDIGTFSFFPGKNMGALGDAGALVTKSESLARRARELRDHGRAAGSKYEHGSFGWNMRMDGLQAAFLRAKLPHLESWTKRRREIADQYRQALSGQTSLTLLEEPMDTLHCYHLFVVLLSERDAMRECLNQQAVASGIHYPLGCHEQPSFQEQFGRLKLPGTEKLSKTCLSLPIFPEMRTEEVTRVIDVLIHELSQSSQAVNI